MFNTTPGLFPLRGASFAAPAIKKSIDWAALLSNTQKTLNIVNQAIPIVYQAKTIFNNAKTMFRLASEISKAGKSSSNSNNIVQNNNTNTNTESYSNYNSEENQPMFFF